MARTGTMDDGGPRPDSDKVKATKRKRVDEGQGKRRKVASLPVDIIVEALNNDMVLDEETHVAMCTVVTIGEVSAIYSRLSESNPNSPHAEPSPVYRKVRFLQLLKAMATQNPKPILEFVTLMCRMVDGKGVKSVVEFRNTMKPIVGAVYHLRRKNGDEKYAAAVRAHVAAITSKFSR